VPRPYQRYPRVGGDFLKEKSGNAGDMRARPAGGGCFKLHFFWLACQRTAEYSARWTLQASFSCKGELILSAIQSVAGLSSREIGHVEACPTLLFPRNASFPLDLSSSHSHFLLLFSVSTPSIRSVVPFAPFPFDTQPVRIRPCPPRRSSSSVEV
jgi:hypothetical protein